MQYQLLASDFDNTLVPFGEPKPRPAVVNAITCNGACGVDKNGTIVAEHPLTNEEMYALVDFCEDYNYPLQFNYRDAYYAYCEYDALKSFYDAMPKSGLSCLDGEDQERHLIDMPHAAFVVMPPQELAHFNEKFGHLNLHFMQVGGVGKDGWCCYDVVRGGMDNGTPDAKAAADRVIGDVREDGLAALIEELWFDGPKAGPSGRDLGSAWDAMEKAGVSE